jgi:hypothetical protein
METCSGMNWKTQKGYLTLPLILFSLTISASRTLSASANGMFSSNTNAIPILLQWLKGQDLAKPGSQDLREQIHATMSTEERGAPEDLQSLALKGFDYLGSNATSALPELRRLVYSLPSPFGEVALDAMVSIGIPSWPTATNLAQNQNPDLRRKGAYLLGALQTNPAQSIPVLLKLIDDPDRAVSGSALTAMGEFPSSEIPTSVRERLLNPDTCADAAYAIHAGGSSAMQLLIDTCRAATTDRIRNATLGALAFRERPRRIADSTDPRRSAYRRKRCDFDLQLGLSAALHPNFDDTFLVAVKSNIIRFQEPRIRGTASNLFAKAKSLPLPINPFAPREISGQYFLGNMMTSDSITIFTNGAFSFHRRGCIIGAVSEVRGRVERDGEMLRLTEETRSIPRMGMQIEEGLKFYRSLYPVFWDKRTYLVPTNSMSEFCAAVNGEYEPRRFPIGNYLVKTESWDKLVQGLPEVPEAWKDYILTNQIRGKVWHSKSSREAWVNLGKKDGVLPGMILYCYDPHRPVLYARVPQVRVVEVNADICRVVPAKLDSQGLYEGLIIDSGRLK